METKQLQTTEVKKTWEAPTLTEINKSIILGGPGTFNDGNNGVGAGAAGAAT
jgi:hypothetical protein